MWMVLLVCGMLPPRYTSTRSNKVIEIIKCRLQNSFCSTMLHKYTRVGGGADPSREGDDDRKKGRIQIILDS